MEKAFFNEVARAAIDQMPPETRFRPEDAQTIARHRELLLSWEAEFVQRFYDTLFAYPTTRAVFRDGERPERENTLKGWWEKTVGAEIGEDYFAWMAYVGLVHVVRKVENPMMLAMAAFTVQFVEDKAAQLTGSGAGDLLELVEAFQRLTGTVGAVITYGYDQSRIQALFNVAGMEPALLERLTQQEAENFIKQVRR